MKPEDNSLRRRRKKNGGNKGKRFTEGCLPLLDFLFQVVASCGPCLLSSCVCWFFVFIGWVEFAEKKIAKRVARGLNNTTMGGKKSSKYYDDMWSIKVAYAILTPWRTQAHIQGDLRKSEMLFSFPFLCF